MCLQGLRVPPGSCKLLKCLMLGLWHGRGHRFDPGQVHHIINSLACCQEKHDTLKIRWFSSRIFCGILRQNPRTIHQNIDKPALSLSFVWRQSFCVNVHCCRDVGVAHQFLNHFHIFPVGFEQSGIGVPESVEAVRAGARIDHMTPL